MTVESRADAAPYPEVALRGKHWKIPARQRTSTAAMSNWGGSATRFEYVHAMVITMNGTSIAAYRRRLRALLCVANPHAPAHSATAMYSSASFALDRTFAR